MHTRLSTWKQVYPQRSSEITIMVLFQVSNKELFSRERKYYSKYNPPLLSRIRFWIDISNLSKLLMSTQASQDLSHRSLTVDIEPQNTTSHKTSIKSISCNYPRNLNELGSTTTLPCLRTNCLCRAHITHISLTNWRNVLTKHFADYTYSSRQWSTSNCNISSSRIPSMYETQVLLLYPTTHFVTPWQWLHDKQRRQWKSVYWYIRSKKEIVVTNITESHKL